MVEGNLTSTFVTVHEFLTAWSRRDRRDRHDVVERGRFLDKTTQAAYAAAKAGVIMFTRHLAMEVGSYRLRANCVAPATTMSERIARLMTPEAIDEPPRCRR